MLFLPKLIYNKHSQINKNEIGAEFLTATFISYCTCMHTYDIYIHMYMLVCVCMQAGAELEIKELRPIMKNIFAPTTYISFVSFDVFTCVVSMQQSVPAHDAHGGQGK